MSTKNAMFAIAVAAAVLGFGCGGIGDSQSRLRSAVDAKKPTLDDCYASALERDRARSGTMDLWLHVNDESGRVEKVEVSESSVADPALQQCVETALVGVQLDPPPGAPMKVDYTLQFRPSS